MAEFSDLRAQISIERVFTEMLGVSDFRPCGSKQRIGTCPACGSKALKLTPSMGLCNCFGKCGLGGDILKVVARVRKLSLSEAGNAIEAHFGITTSRPVNGKASTVAPFDPIAYQARLDPEHEALIPLGLSTGIIREFGGGWIGKGKLANRLALPLYNGDKIASFFGIAIDDASIKLASDDDKDAIFNTIRLEEGEPLTVCRDPLAVLRAAENGDTQAVAVFSDYTPDTLRQIASLMEATKIETAELF
jgi:hypothetical protein